MFLGKIFAKRAKNDPKTLFETPKSVNIGITVKSRNDFFEVISKSFLKIST